MRFRKKPVVIEAVRWFKNGDHPNDNCWKVIPVPGDGEPYLSEGEIVRYYRNPGMAGTALCSKCKFTFHEHGWIDTLEGGHTVCVGDWIIRGIKRELYPCKPDIFEMTYEAAE